MASAAEDSGKDPFIPMPAGFLGLLVLGGVAVLVLPAIADALPHPGRAAQARYATTALGILLVTGAYVYLVAATRPGLEGTWVAVTLVYVTGLVIVKFILSPTAYERSPGTSLGAFVAAGLFVVPLYLAALTLIHRVSDRRRNGWSLASKLALAAGLAVVAVITRLVVAFVLGTASEYLDNFVGQGLILPVVVLAASLAVMESFDRAGPHARDALHAGAAIVVAHHLAWVLYMFTLFS